MLHFQSPFVVLHAQSPFVVLHFQRLSGLIFAAAVLIQLDPLDLSMRQNLPQNNEILKSHLVKNVHIALIVLMQHESDMRAAELKVQTFFLFLLIRRLGIVVGEHEAQFAVVLPRAQLDEDIDELGYLVLVEDELQFFGADGHVELDG